MITEEKLEDIRGKARVRSAKQRENDSMAREIDNALPQGISQAGRQTETPGGKARHGAHQIAFSGAFSGASTSRGLSDI